MKVNLAALFFLSILTFVGPVMAGPASDALGKCMVGSLTGNERIEMAKWIFMAMAAHPEMASLAHIPPEERNATDKKIGRLFTRLLAEDCAKEAKTAVATESKVAVDKSFELLGRVAMQELITNENVSEALVSYTKYLDKKKLEFMQ